MLRIEVHGDVTRICMSTRAGRSLGYTASAYLVRGVLVDTGFPAVARQMAALLRSERPAGALITHWHEDHAGNVGLLAATGVPLALSDATLARLRDMPDIGWYRRVVWGTVSPFRARFQRFEPDTLRLVPTPGHSDDHHVVWDAERETLFSGDLFLGVKVRLAHPGENPRELARSVRAAAALHPNRMFDAHRGLVPRPVEALLAKAQWLDNTIGEIERRIDAGWNDRAIVQDVLGREQLTSVVSRGKMSKENLVRAVRRGAGG